MGGVPLTWVGSNYPRWGVTDVGGKGLTIVGLVSLSQVGSHYLGGVSPIWLGCHQPVWERSHRCGWGLTAPGAISLVESLVTERLADSGGGVRVGADGPLGEGGSCAGCRRSQSGRGRWSCAVNA